MREGTPFGVPSVSLWVKVNVTVNITSRQVGLNMIRLGTPVKVARLGTVATYSFGRSIMGEGGSIPEHEYDPDCEYRKSGNCFYCCESCNYDSHRCFFCGSDLDHNSYNFNGEPHECYEEEDMWDLMDLLKSRGAI